MPERAKRQRLARSQTAAGCVVAASGITIVLTQCFEERPGVSDRMINIASLGLVLALCGLALYLGARR